MINDTETYNGWKNRATWNAHLWLTGNGEGPYRLATEVVRGYSLEVAALELEMWCDNLWGSETPDGDSLALVDWVHVAEALRS